jgi:hypothetical protein
MRNLDAIKSAEYSELKALEIAAVVYALGLNAEVDLDDDGDFYYSLHDRRRVVREVDANLILLAEESMYERDFLDAYTELMAGKASVDAYSGLSETQQRLPSTAMKFYRVLGAINLEHSMQVLHELYKTK